LRKRGAVALAVAGLLILSCYAEILDVLMPEEAPPDGNFHVSVTIEAYAEEMLYGVFGILFPDTWLAEDAYYWWDESWGEGEGQLIPNQECTDWLEATHPAPDGYRWKGFLTDSYVEDGVYSNAHAEFDVLNDERLGSFSFHFVLGHTYDCDPIEELDYQGPYYITIQDEGGVEETTWGQLKSMF
jgi:hypothetical protein